jgi:hypothetical protein
MAISWFVSKPKLILIFRRVKHHTVTIRLFSPSPGHGVSAMFANGPPECGKRQTAKKPPTLTVDGLDFGG